MGTVKVWRNRHKDMWSVKSGKEPVTHTNEIVLFNPEFRVQQSGWKRALREKRRNVHAYVKGYIINKSFFQNILFEVKYDITTGKFLYHYHGKWSEILYPFIEVIFTKEGKCFAV